MAATFAFLVGCILMSDCLGNQFDPHLYPRKGPFFEGWYLRIMDEKQSVSIGFLFGRVLPAGERVKGATQNSGKTLTPLLFGDKSFTSARLNIKQSRHMAFGRMSALGTRKHNPLNLMSAQGQTLDLRYYTYLSDKKPSYKAGRESESENQRPLVIATILLQTNNTGPQLQSYNGIFNVDDYLVKAKGKPVVKNPDDESPADFSVKFGRNGSYAVAGEKMHADVTVGNINFMVRGSNPVPWGPNGEGPEEWLEYLPLPLHWFVYSLRSHVSEYKLFDQASGLSIAGRNAVMHMEKNWGDSFPPGWIWAQGVTSSNISLALSGGIVDFDVLNVTAFLVGYRNPAKGIVFNFTPANSIFTFKHSGCDGFVHLNVTSLEDQLILKIYSPVKGFSNCLLGPESDGFRPACVESYSAVAVVTALKRKLLHYDVVDHVEIQNAGLEFGGLYMCKGMCA